MTLMSTKVGRDGRGRILLTTAMSCFRNEYASLLMSCLEAAMLPDEDIAH